LKKKNAGDGDKLLEKLTRTGKSLLKRRFWNMVLSPPVKKL